MNFWKSDEVVTSAYSVTDDFYKYYSISKTSEKSEIFARGTDVSEYQGVIDWNKVKVSGMVDFVILRAGDGEETN